MQIMDTIWPASECASCRLWTLSGLRVSALHADYGHWPVSECASRRLWTPPGLHCPLQVAHQGDITFHLDTES